MEINNIQIRCLDINDYEQYIELLNSSTKLLKTEKTPEYSNYLTNQLKSDLTHEDKIIIGAFDTSNKLVCSASGYFPKTFLHWYSFNQFSNFGKNDLAAHKLSMLVWARCMRKLISHGEQNGYYSFYSRRPLGDQKAIDRVWEKFSNEKLIENRYRGFYETVYRANETCKSSNHSFYFSGFYKSFNIDTVVCIYMLTQQNRLELLKIQ